MGAAHRKATSISVSALRGGQFLTALALETVFQLTPAKRTKPGRGTWWWPRWCSFTELLAAVEDGMAKWNHFVKSKVQDSLPALRPRPRHRAFLAVYREGFETILFYKALFLTGGQAAGAMPILGGYSLARS